MWGAILCGLICEAFSGAHYVKGGHENAALNDSMNVRYIGHLDTPGQAYGVAVQGAYAYVADGQALRIVDITNPSEPSEVGCLQVQNGGVHDVWVDGSYAYLATGSGLITVDVSDPTSPQIAGVLNMQRTSYRLMVVDSIAYVAADSGLIIVDISNPASPGAIGIYVTQWSLNDVYVMGRYAYLAGTDSLMIIDIADPTDPHFVAGLAPEGQCRGIFVSDHYAYLASYVDLKIYDVQNPANPQLISTYDQPQARFVGVFVQNDIAYTITSRHGIYILDVSDPSNPQDTGFYYNAYGTMTDANIIGNYIYVAAYSDGLQIYEFDVGGGGTPGGDSLRISYIGHLPLDGDAYGVHVQGNYAYVASGYHGLEVVDVSDPFHPFEAARVPVNAWNAADVFVSGNYAYVVTDGDRGLHIIDISNPQSPDEVGYLSVSGDGYGYRVFVSGNYAYLATGNGLRIVDVSNPSSPVEVGHFDTRFADWDVYVDGNYAYLAALEDFYVVDVSNPASPESLTCLTLYDQIRRVFVHNGYAYLSRWSDMKIYDVSDPANPILAHTFDPSGHISGAFVQDSLAFVITDRHGWWLLDVSNPADPGPIDYYYNLYGTLRDIYVQGEYAYIAAYADGLQIYWISTTGVNEDPVDAGSHDIAINTIVAGYNAVLSFTLPISGAFSISIYDVTGRMVWHEDGPLSSGSHRIRMPVKLSSGVYVLKFLSSSGIETHKLVRIE